MLLNNKYSALCAELVPNVRFARSFVSTHNDNCSSVRSFNLTLQQTFVVEFKIIKFSYFRKQFMDERLQQFGQKIDVK